MAVSALLLFAGAARAEGPAFDLVVQAPQPLRELLDRHLELGRFRAVADLDEAELARLITLADRDARELLATQGHFAPKITITREPAGAATPRPRLLVRVEPGEPARVTDVRITFEGDLAQSAEADAIAQREAVVAGWALPAGRVFTQAAWDDAKMQALQAVLARRYPAARIAATEADVDAAAGTARLAVRIDSGPLYRLGPVRVAGMSLYDPQLVERLSRLPPGSPFDRARLLDAQARLAASGWFDSAFLHVDPQTDPEAAVVQATVRESPLRKWVLGIGFTTDGGPRLSAEHTHNRVPWLGWRAITRAQAERRNPFLQADLTAPPEANGWHWTLLGRTEKLDDGERITQAQRLRLGRARAEDRFDRGFFVQLDRASSREPAALRLTDVETGDGSAVFAGVTWTGRWFDDLQAPTRGWGLGAEVGAGLTFGSRREPFQRTLVRGLAYQPLAEGRIQWRGEAAAVFARSEARIPATQLFRTGGATSVRGYAYQDIGVPLAGGQVGPGRLMMVGSAEWQRPLRREGLPTALESALFVDVGAVGDEPGDLLAKVGVGGGVRWKSPVGLLEVALAWGVQPRRVRLHFNAGFVF